MNRRNVLGVLLALCHSPAHFLTVDFHCTEVPQVRVLDLVSLLPTEELKNSWALLHKAVAGDALEELASDGLQERDLLLRLLGGKLAERVCNAHVTDMGVLPEQFLVHSVVLPHMLGPLPLVE